FNPFAAPVSNEEPLIFQVDIYDFMAEPDGSGATQAWAEFRSMHGESWQSTIFAMGVFGDGGTHYRARIYPTHDWVTLSAERSEGWPSFSFVIRGDTVDVYVDQDPYAPESQPDPNATNLEWTPQAALVGPLALDTLHLGGGSSTGTHAFLFDNVYIANDPELALAITVTEQPGDDYPGKGAVRNFGESVTFNVVAEGL